MTNKKILLVEDDYNEIIRIQQSLSKLEGQHSLHVAHKITDALQVLMGGSSQYGMENYGKTGKVRPDIVLLNISFLQHSAREFLEVMNKYYSLKNIRVFIFGNTDESLDPELAQKYNIAGYLTTPINLSDTINESMVRFRRELTAPGKTLFSAPLLALNKKFVAVANYVKAKTAICMSQAVVAKLGVSTAAASLLVAGVVSPGTEEKRAPVQSHAQHSMVVKTFQPAAERPCEQEKTVQTECPVLPERHQTVKHETKQQAQPVKVTPPPAETAVADADRAPERKYRIVAVEETE